MITEEDELRDQQEEQRMEGGQTPGATPFTPFTPAEEEMSPDMSREASTDADGMPKGPPKILRIRRYVCSQEVI